MSQTMINKKLNLQRVYSDQSKLLTIISLLEEENELLVSDAHKIVLSMCLIEKNLTNSRYKQLIKTLNDTELFDRIESGSILKELERYSLSMSQHLSVVTIVYTITE